MSYYFFAASLPMINFGSEPGMTTDEFIEMCSHHLTASDFASLCTAMAFLREQAPGDDEEEMAVPQDIRNCFARSAIDHEVQIRNAIAQERSKRLSRDAAGYLRPTLYFNSHIPDAVSAAVGLDNPRDGERVLDSLRWNIIENLQGTDAFSADAIIAYGMKLALAERWASFDEDEGRKVVESAIEQLVENRRRHDAEEENTL